MTNKNLSQCAIAQLQQRLSPNLMQLRKRSMTVAVCVGGLLIALFFGSIAAVATQIEYEDYQTKHNNLAVKKEQRTFHKFTKDGQNIFECCFRQGCGFSKKAAVGLGL